LMVSSAQIRAARALLNWSQEHLAKRAGVSRRTLGTFERDEAPIQPEMLKALARALGEAGIEFLSGEDWQSVSGPRPK
jgi:transcriptional regulator with XRE-family HTH domain